jgi:hypothetical protein
MAADVTREYVTNSAGLRVGVDVGRDMDRATFDSLVERGDLTPVKQSSSKSKSSK